MKILVDANILLRMANQSDPEHARVVNAVLHLDGAGVEICLVSQTLYEFWVVATRPLAMNGLGLSADEARDSVKYLVQTYELFRDEARIFDLWQALVSAHAVKGKNAHDARYVAAMICHGLTHFLTLNTADFHRFNVVRVLSPHDILAGVMPTER